MRLYPEKLAAHLQQQLLPVYLVSGDEPLLLQECSDQIRHRAREQGCSEREVIDGGVSSFKWQDILHSASSMSLFAERKLVELRLPSGKPGAEGSKALCEYLDMASGDDARVRRNRRVRLLVVGPAEDHRGCAGIQQLADDGDTVLGRLPGCIDGLGHPLSQGAVVIDPGKAQVGERQPPQHRDCIVGSAGSRAHIVDETAQCDLVHPSILPRPAHSRSMTLSGAGIPCA